MNGKAKEVKHKWILLAAVTTAGFLADIGTKYLAVTRLEPGRPVNVIGEYLQWLLVYNEGAVFGTKPPGFFSWMHPGVFLSIFMLFAISFLIFYYRALKKNEVLMHIGLMLVLPGAFGNLYDRLIHGKKGVVDFIRMGFPPDSYWFIYNVADIFVTAGVAIMLVNFLLEAVGKRPQEESAAAVGINTDGINQDGINTDSIKPDGINTSGINTDSVKPAGINADGINAININPDGINKEADTEAGS